MLTEWLCEDVGVLYRSMPAARRRWEEPDLALVRLASAVYEALTDLCPDQAAFFEHRLAVTFHLAGRLREAGIHYRRVLDLAPVTQPSGSEWSNVFRFAPVLMINHSECFPLMDVVAIHHPEQPLIGYHLFWEDDYDFPDDYEPCDHEVIWVSYDPESGSVTGVWCFFHSYVLTTREAVKSANAKGGRPTVYVEWGKHGSLLDGWSQAQDHEGRQVVPEMLKAHHERAGAGGRLAGHPLKRRWPSRFEGSFEDYLRFDTPLDTRDWLQSKRMIARCAYANAVLQQHFLLYNFHPKYDWPAEVPHATLRSPEGEGAFGTEAAAAHG